MSSRSWLLSAAVVLATAVPAAAQPPSPLLLVQGIRESGMPDLALEYLQEIEKLNLPPLEKQAIPLERAKCLLDSADDEPDEGTRTSMVGEAKEAFNSFLLANAKHPRAAEASLALARLTSIEAKAQLNRGRRMEVPPEGDPGRDAAVKAQREEMLKARPLFLLASQRFAEAAKQLKDKLGEPNLEPVAKAALAREVFDADLAAAVNKYYLADTFVVTGATDTIERDKYLEQARETFAALAKGPPTSRNVWIARAWMAEILGDQGKPNDMATEFTAILNVPRAEAEEGKRLVRFFQVRRNYLAALTDQGKLAASERELRSWLGRYGNSRKPTPEIIAARFYLAFSLQIQAVNLIGPPPKTGEPPPLSQTARTRLQEAEKLYRALGQSDNDYTARAIRNRMFVVRKLLGEADRSPAEYPTFEAAQMAALIQMAKLNDAEKLLERARADGDGDAAFWAGLALMTGPARVEREVKDRQYRVVALLERARELANDRDNPADVADNLLRLVYFYQITDQPLQAAVLGEHISRTIKTTGGKSAIAGLLALNAYVNAGKSSWSLAKAAEVIAAAKEIFPFVPELDPEMIAEQEQVISVAATASRKSDRERAIQMAQFLDEKFPNDAATDAARHRLAILHYEDGKPDAAFEAVIKIRPGYSGILNARQFEGYVAAVLVGSKDAGVTPERKVVVFRRAVGDLARLPKPAANAPADDVRGYLSCRVRLAQLYLSQDRVDPEAEKAGRGYDRALAIADEIIGTVPTYAELVDKKSGLPDGLNLDGLEMRYQGFSIRTRAIYLRGRSLIDDEKIAEAAAAIDPAVADAAKGNLVDARMKKWAEGQGDDGDDEDAAKQKAKIAELAVGIDKIRRDVVMVGFKLRCVQGKPAEAQALLEQLKKSGGGIETNQAGLEFVARELAAQIPALRKQGKAKEADDLGAGLAILLKEFTNVKNLPPTTILFLGQTFHTVGKYDEAIAEFRKIAVPVVPKIEGLPPQWWKVDAAKIGDGQARNKFRDEVRDYRFAQLNLGKSLRGANKLDEAEKLFAEAVGGGKDAMGKEKPEGYAFTSLDFRKELATTYEARGAAAGADTKAANAYWKKGLDEWSTLFRIAQSQVSKADEKTPADQLKRLKSNFFDAYFEVQRVLVAANTQLVKDPAKLGPTFEQVGRRIADMEASNKFNDVKEIDTPQGKQKVKVASEVITPEVALRYHEFLEKYPGVKAAYQANGGKFFLERPRD
jgi:hypothetical protein